MFVLEWGVALTWVSVAHDHCYTSVMHQPLELTWRHHNLCIWCNQSPARNLSCVLTGCVVSKCWWCFSLYELWTCPFLSVVLLMSPVVRPKLPRLHRLVCLNRSCLTVGEGSAQIGVQLLLLRCKSGPMMVVVCRVKIKFRRIITFVEQRSFGAWVI